MLETLLLATMGVQALGSVLGAKASYDASKANRSAFEYQAAVDSNNAVLAEYQARDALARGELMANDATARGEILFNDALRSGDLLARDALFRGEQELFSQRLKQGQLEGTQRATMAARGVALDEGSPLNILLDTRFMGDIDAATIKDNADREAWSYRDSGARDARNARYNAEREAWGHRDAAERDAFGFRTQGSNYRANAGLLDMRAGAENPGLMATSSLLNGAGNVASTWFRYRSVR